MKAFAMVQEKTFQCHVPLSTDEAWAFITHNPVATFYLNTIGDFSTRVAGPGAGRVMMVKWRGRFGSLAERCCEYEPYKRAMWKIYEDSRGVFAAFNEFHWGFELVPKGTDRSTLLLVVRYECRKSVFSFLSEQLLHRRLTHTAAAIERRFRKPVAVQPAAGLIRPM